MATTTTIIMATITIIMYSAYFPPLPSLRARA
jgi:hypothetical protein